MCFDFAKKENLILQIIMVLYEEHMIDFLEIMYRLIPRG